MLAVTCWLRHPRAGKCEEHSGHRIRFDLRRIDTFVYDIENRVVSARIDRYLPLGGALAQIGLDWRG